MYKHLTKETILQAPQCYAWNILLREMQFTQEELLKNRDYCPLPEMIRFQQSVTMLFLREHYQADIDACLEVDWEDCKKYTFSRYNS